MKKMMVLVLVFGMGCTGLSSYETTPADDPVRACLDSCRHYDDSYLVYYALGMVCSGTTAAAGTGGVMTATLADEPGADIALASTAGVAGIGAVVFNWVAGQQAERYEECKAECREARPAPEPDPITLEPAAAGAVP